MIRTAADNRRFVEAVLWIARTGATWRDLPEDFGPWNSVYVRFRRWAEDGVWERVLAPPHPSRASVIAYDKHLYKERHLVECFINRLKQFRRIATRYDKTPPASKPSSS